jgi:hypothetical protein
MTEPEYKHTGNVDDGKSRGVAVEGNLVGAGGQGELLINGDTWQGIHLHQPRLPSCYNHLANGGHRADLMNMYLYCSNDVNCIRTGSLVSDFCFLNLETVSPLLSSMWNI